MTFDRDLQDRSVTVRMEGVSLEQALQQIMLSNGLFYRVLNERTIIVAADQTQKRQQYKEQVIRTFFISHADASELNQLLTALIRVAGMAIQPQISFNKTTNTITIRATAPVMQIAEKIIEANDKPRAEVMVDVQILEVSRERTKAYGLDLGSYSAALAFSPESAPGDDREAVQPQYDLARHQHGRLLPVGAVRGGALPRKRFADEGAREAEPARHGRAEAVVEPR